MFLQGPGQYSGALHSRDQQEPGPGGPGHDEDRVQGQRHQAQPGPYRCGPVDQIENIQL